MVVAEPRSQSHPFIVAVFADHFVNVFFDDSPASQKTTGKKPKCCRKFNRVTKIVTIGGIYGKVEGVKDKYPDGGKLKDVKINISRSAVASKVEEKVVS